MTRLKLWLAVSAAVSGGGVAAAVESTELSIPPAKPGLYELRKTSNIAIFIARDFSQTPLAEQKRLSDEALLRPGPIFQMCITPETSHILDQMVGKKPGCSDANIQLSPNGFAADVSCGGKPPIHVDFRVETDHRSITVSGQSLAKAAISLIDKYDVRWLAADCGAVKPGGMIRSSPETASPK